MSPLLALAFVTFATTVQAQTAHEIVVNADKVRNPDKPFRVDPTFDRTNAHTDRRR